VVLEPASGRLTGADTARGRLPEAEEITTLAGLMLERGDALPYDMSGVKVLVTAGGTRNRWHRSGSSATAAGKQGYAVARVMASAAPRSP
jgi:phosphopantothenoylcysteine decarboxylase/phosphopantothenate--cysteine ligase